jgi:hypothetical protein
MQAITKLYFIGRVHRVLPVTDMHSLVFIMHHLCFFVCLFIQATEVFHLKGGLCRVLPVSNVHSLVFVMHHLYFFVCLFIQVIEVFYFIGKVCRILPVTDTRSLVVIMHYVTNVRSIVFVMHHLILCVPACTGHRGAPLKRRVVPRIACLKCAQPFVIMHHLCFFVCLFIQVTEVFHLKGGLCRLLPVSNVHSLVFIMHHLCFFVCLFIQVTEVFHLIGGVRHEMQTDDSFIFSKVRVVVCVCMFVCVCVWFCVCV